MWNIKQISDIKLNNPILIEGLPGMGNVGKIAVDFIIDSLNAKKIYEIHSYKFPNSVFINEDNIIELPSISIYYKKTCCKDFLFVSGDIQPGDEISCHELCDKILELLKKNKGNEIITLGGIGLQNIPKNPKVFCTGTSKKIIKSYLLNDVKDDTYKFVGPIIGVTGILLGLANKRKMEGVSLLTETFGHPNYLGFNGAKKLINVLSKKFNFKIDLSKLDKEGNDVEKNFSSKLNLKESTEKEKNNEKDLTYIG